MGDVSPSVSFSTAKQTSLENGAKNIGRRTRQNQRQQSAKTLGFKIAAVKALVDNGLSSNYVSPCGGGGGSLDSICSGSNLELIPSASLAKVWIYNPAKTSCIIPFKSNTTFTNL